MKKCTKCKEDKPLDEFRRKAKSKDGRSPWCKLCAGAHDNEAYKTSQNRRSRVRDTARERYKRNRNFIFNYMKNSSCFDCGEDDPIVLEFDHDDDVEKLGVISNMVGQGLSIENLTKEISKCTVRCANCHRRRTAKQLGWYNYGSVAEMD